MTVITVFAFHAFDCEYCADAKQRQAWSHLNDDGNKRMLVWICNGWIAVIIHLITSLLMVKVVDPGYNLNVTSQTEHYWEGVKRRHSFVQRLEWNITKMKK